jgi:hypothetical protein
MIDTVSKSMVRQGLEALDKALQARVAAQAENRPVEYKPPTETEFAGAVAKDVAGGVLSIAEVRMVLYIVPVVAVLIILALILSRCGG